MQIKTFTIPILGGEKEEKALNSFLRGQKVLKVESKLVEMQQNAYWCFIVQYLIELIASPLKKPQKVDYKAILNEKSFERFSKMRKIRKELAREEGIPAYAIFTDKELAKLAEFEEVTLAKVQGIKGVGQQKVNKYGPRFLNIQHEASQESTSSDS